MKLKFTRKYKFAHGGTRIEEFLPGQVVETASERLCQVALKDNAAISLDNLDIAAAVPESKPKNPKCKA